MSIPWPSSALLLWSVPLHHSSGRSGARHDSNFASALRAPWTGHDEKNSIQNWCRILPAGSLARSGTGTNHSRPGKGGGRGFPVHDRHFHSPVRYRCTRRPSNLSAQWCDLSMRRRSRKRSRHLAASDQPHNHRGFIGMSSAARFRIAIPTPGVELHKPAESE
jgi:hypothetical protein